MVVFVCVGLYLPAEYYAAWADCLTEPLAERLSECLQTLQHVLRRVHSAILITGKKKNRKHVNIRS